MTLSTTTLLDLLKQQNYQFFSGVPCSNFADLFEQVSLDQDITSVPAASEGSALAFAVGAALAGRRSVVALQNSGLGNIINPLTSLVQINCIPTLLLVSVRGHIDEPEDEPQHRIMGANTHALLDQLAIPGRVRRDVRGLHGDSPEGRRGIQAIALVCGSGPKRSAVGGPRRRR